MKKNNILIIIFTFALLLPKAVFAAADCSIIKELLGWCQAFWNVIIVLGPAIFIVMSLVDLARTITSGEDAAFKKYIGKTVKRLIAVLALVLLPVLINALLSLINATSGTCGIE